MTGRNVDVARNLDGRALRGGTRLHAVAGSGEMMFGLCPGEYRIRRYISEVWGKIVDCAKKPYILRGSLKVRLIFMYSISKPRF